MQASIFTHAAARACYVLFIIIILSSWPRAGRAADDITTLLAGDAPQVQIAGEIVWSTPFLRELYAEPNSAPRWSTQQLAVLRRAIAESFADGLDPHDFLADRLDNLDSLPSAMREILATEALARLAFTLRFGKCNPEALDPDWNFSRSFGKTNPTLWLRE